MKLFIKILLVFFALLVLPGCAGMGKKAPPPIAVDPGELETLRPSIGQCLIAGTQSLTGDLNSLPFISLGDKARISIDKIPQASSFRTESLRIIEYFKTKQGINHLCFLSQSRDPCARIDRRVVKVVYRTQSPDSIQTKRIQQWLLQENNQIKELNNALGVFAEDFLMLNILSLQNQIYYSNNPEHMLLILPYEIFVQEEKILVQGFQSWLKLKKLGISKQEFKDRVQKGQRYILFVYFFDRVDPDFGLNVHFSTSTQRRGIIGKNRDYRARPGTWPVITRTFSINRIPEELYINIFLTQNPLTGTCIKSHRIF